MGHKFAFRGPPCAKVEDNFTVNAFYPHHSLMTSNVVLHCSKCKETWFRDALWGHLIKVGHRWVRHNLAIVLLLLGSITLIFTPKYRLLSISTLPALLYLVSTSQGIGQVDLSLPEMILDFVQYQGRFFIYFLSLMFHCVPSEVGSC